MSAEPTDNGIKKLAQLVRNAARVVALTGAGISTESGIPDYRGPGGIWESGKPPTLGDYRTNAETRRTYWQERRERYPKLAAAQPNAGHLGLVSLERTGILRGIVTQNIDGLHQKAGSSATRVHELHGSAHRIVCFDCGSEWDAADIQLRLLDGEEDPHCHKCGGIMRAGTILFGEQLPPQALKDSVNLASNCDLMIVIGTSLVVRPAAQLPELARERGASIAIMNQMTTPLDAIADVMIQDGAGSVMTSLIESI